MKKLFSPKDKAYTWRVLDLNRKGHLKDLLDDKFGAIIYNKGIQE